MKKSVLLLVFAVSMAVIGCKKEKAEDNAEAPKEAAASNGFNVVLDVIIKQDDEISLFYTTDGGTDFSKIPAITQKMKGSATSQLLSFTLPEGAKPTQFRVDFGTNPKQEDIYFNSITFKYLGKERTIACPEMLDYFRANDTYCSFNTATGLIQAKTGPNGERFFPSIYPNEKNLLPVLEKLW